MEPSISTFNLFFASSPIVQMVLMLLIALSILSWAIIIAKFFQLRRAKMESAQFSSIFWETRDFSHVDNASQRLDHSPLAQVFHGGYRELSHVIQESNSKESAKQDPEILLGTVSQALKRSAFDEAVQLENGITFLATVASAAPFIGLFGTVWGIMNAFNGLSLAKNSTIQAVAPGISEALVATAVGLAAAIPATVAFNFFVVSVRRFREAMEKFSEEFLAFARRFMNE